jgi:hypothetical protein
MLQADKKWGNIKHYYFTMEMQKTILRHEPCFFGGRSFSTEMEIPWGVLVMTAK